MLYGDSGSLFSPSKEEPRRSSQPPADRDPTPFRAEPTHWCLLVRENGAMEVGGAPPPPRPPSPGPRPAAHLHPPPQVYQLPDWRLVFLVKNFPVGQRVLVDSSFGQPTTQGEARKEEATRQGELPLVKEVLLVALGSRQSRPYLLVSPGPPLGGALHCCPFRLTTHCRQVHVDQELLIYEAFPHDSQLGQGNLKVRFKKVGWPAELGVGPAQSRVGAGPGPHSSTPRFPTTSTSGRRSQSCPRRRQKAAAPRRGLEPGAEWRGSATSRTFMAIQG